MLFDILLFACLVLGMFVVIQLSYEANDTSLSATILTCFLCIGMWCLFTNVRVNNMEAYALNAGVAHYDAKTGDLVWDDKTVENVLKHRSIFVDTN